jgi:hypothetical protein
MGFVMPGGLPRTYGAHPEPWRWSSYRFYLLGEVGAVRVNEGWTEISFRDVGAIFLLADP